MPEVRSVEALVPMPKFETVTDYLSWDHDRLEAILEATRRAVEEGRLADARAIYRGFDDGLARHIRIEEELLFPVFEAKSGIAEGPTTVMRTEHKAIQLAISMMREGLDALDPVGFGAGFTYLQSVLPGHNAKEEHILYPTTDRLLTEHERIAFTAHLRRS
jgi:iron-sulfur cluster repair protein YtfE (RIC family)